MMDDENRKEENEGASTSKKKEDKEKAALDKTNDYEECDRDDLSFTSSMTDYSARSRALKNEKRREREQANRLTSKMAQGKRRNPPRVRRGRVAKRKRAYQPTKRRHNVRPPAPREESVSSHYSASNRQLTAPASRSCNFCGHRCCGRRYAVEVRKSSQSTISDPTSDISKDAVRKRCRKPKTLSSQRKKRKTRSERNKVLENSRNIKKIVYKTGVTLARLAMNQVGSTAKVLSPLLVATSDKGPNENENDPEPPPPRYSIDITPEMIYEVLVKQTMWTQVVSFNKVMEGLKIGYPVNPDQEELAKELSEKLTVSAIAGITMEVVKNGVKSYCLTFELMRKGLDKTHVTLFWQIYADTMKPIRKRVIPPDQPPPPPLKPAVEPKPKQLQKYDNIMYL